MNGKNVSFATMQADHRQWDHVHSIWRVDLESWRREHEAALSELSDLQDMIREHGQALEAQATAIEHQQQDLRSHERAISEYEHPLRHHFGSARNATALGGRDSGPDAPSRMTH